jgi:hypothetical protein
MSAYKSFWFTGVSFQLAAACFFFIHMEFSVSFYSSPPTDISLGRSNLPRSLYIFGIVVALLLVASNKIYK